MRWMGGQDRSLVGERTVQLPDNSQEETAAESGGVCVRFHTSVPLARWERGEEGVTRVRLVLDCRDEGPGPVQHRGKGTLMDPYPTWLNSGHCRVLI